MDFLSLFLKKMNVFLSDSNTLEMFVNNRFLMILLVVVLLRLKYATYSNIYMCALVNIFGTILHEISHFLVGFMLNARPTSFNIFPKKRGDSYVVGSVGFNNIRFYNALPSALAPLLLLVVGYYLNIWYFLNIKVTYLNYILYVFLQTVIIENAVPSTQDFKVAFCEPLGLLLYGSVFVFAVIYLI